MSQLYHIYKLLKITLDFLSSLKYNDIMELKKGGEIMSPRIGRPKADNPKDIDLKVRVDKNTNDALEKYSKKNNITKAETVRRGIKLLLQKE